MSQTEENQFVEIVAARTADILDALAKDGLNEEDRKNILVAFSGGPDSTALLIALSKAAPQLGLRISACHVNHGLRGVESDLDQEFCEKLCSDLRIPFTAYRLDKLASHIDHIPENLLRDRRYTCLYTHARKLNIRVVASGHTLDDQAETILFRLFRGTSPTGLVGMEPKREMIREGAGVWLVRPLLNQVKMECQRFLAIEQIGSHIDKSNEDTHYARNFIRQLLIPGIEEKFPGWKHRLERLRVIVSEQEDWLAHETAKQLERLRKFDQKGEFVEMQSLSACHKMLQRRMIAELLRYRNLEPTFDRVENILALIDGKDNALSLSAEWEVRVDKDRLRWLEIFEDEGPSPFLLAQETEIRLPDSDHKSRTNVIAWLNRSLRIEALENEDHIESPSASGSLEIVCDLTRVNLPLKVRLRRPGDMIQPFGMSEKVRLKKYLHTHKKTEAFKHTVVMTDAKEVLWIPGVGISERLRFASAPTHRLVFNDLSLPSESRWV